MRPRLTKRLQTGRVEQTVYPLLSHSTTSAMHGLQQDIWTLILRKLAFEDSYHLTCASHEFRALGQSESVWLSVRYVAFRQQQLGFILRLAPLLEHLELTLKGLEVSGEACPARESRLRLLRLASASLASRAPLLGQLAPSLSQSLLNLTLDFLQANTPNIFCSDQKVPLADC